MIGRVVLSALLVTSSAAAFAADSGGDSVSGKEHICSGRPYSASAIASMLGGGSPG
jgi:hypothetical protein